VCFCLCFFLESIIMSGGDGAPTKRPRTSNTTTTTTTVPPSTSAGGGAATTTTSTVESRRDQILQQQLAQDRHIAAVGKECYSKAIMPLSNSVTNMAGFHVFAASMDRMLNSMHMEKLHALRCPEEARQKARQAIYDKLMSMTLKEPVRNVSLSILEMADAHVGGAASSSSSSSTTTTTSTKKKKHETIAISLCSQFVLPPPIPRGCSLDDSELSSDQNTPTMGGGSASGSPLMITAATAAARRSLSVGGSGGSPTATTLSAASLLCLDMVPTHPLEIVSRTSGKVVALISLGEYDPSFLVTELDCYFNSFRYFSGIIHYHPFFG
jgi:hypothetical protein